MASRLIRIQVPHISPRECPASRSIWHITCSLARQMLPGSHAVPINPPTSAALQDSRLLADAFSQFISASAVLEGSYRSLQEEVARLGTELAERNATLSRALTENEQMAATLQQMMDSLPCGVLVLGDRGQITMINPAGRKLLNLGSTRVEHIADLTGVIDSRVFEIVPDSNVETELSLEMKSEKRWLAIDGQKVEGRSICDAAIQSLWILRDITACKLAEQEREAARNAVALAEISTILAHEIRNPLASMELFAGLIQDEPERNTEWAANLLAGIRLASGTVNNVLRMQCAATLRLVPLDLALCARSGVEFLRPIADQAAVSLLFDGGNTPAMFHGNEEAIRQILLNLVSNAIRHTPPGGSITVSVQRCMSRVRLGVTDTGTGIAGELLPHLFDSGVSGDGSTPGLGLAVCKRLVTQLDGTIMVASRIHEGTAFQLEFPAL